VLAAGCFWCIQPPYDKTPGVISTRVGYTGGTKENPTYEEVSSGTTGHIEAIEITYDAKKVSLDKLLDVFWKNIDPLDSKGQFCDKGPQYVSAFFYASDEEKALFEKTKMEVQKKLKQPIATQALAFKKFYPAEDYHQSYYTKNPVRYKFYRYNCGRDKRLSEIWK
ncbi:peptide-methionine (S)-S-oxide reductase MsrA, partial [bacterium]|nr:peptide-methionine (S)-S-oxide reductase MsrA [bacterium]